MIKEEAIEILSDMRAEYNIFSNDEEEATRYHALSWAIQALNEQQRTGQWIVDKDSTGCTYGKCTSCGMKQYAGRTKFCPNCGAKMKVEK